MQVGGIVLCGGNSQRMGKPKAVLPFGPELMVQRVVRLLSTVVSPIVVVAAADQELPEFDPAVLVARDALPDRGPLQGMLAGLQMLAGRAEAAYVTACDAPLLEPKFVAALIDRLGANDIVAPTSGPLHHPLSAVYRTSVVPHVAAMLDADQRRVVLLLDRVNACRVPIDELRAYDPQLGSLKNCNFPVDYLAALTVAGFDPVLEAD